MKTPPHSLLLLLLLLLVATSTSTVSQVTNFYCLGNSTTNTTNNSQFATNLQTALSTLSTASTTSKFSNTSISSTLAALYFCRSDLPLSTCHSCVSNATTYIVSFCPSYTQAIIWYEHCTLRYGAPPLNRLDHPSPYYWSWGGGKVFLHVPDFNKTLVSTLFNTISQAVNTSSPMRYFATGEGVYGKYQKVRCMVQCSPDVSAGDCRICLGKALNLTEINCLGASWGMVFKSHCTMRFGVAPFYAIGNDTNGFVAASPTASVSGGSGSSSGSSDSSKSSATTSRRFGVVGRAVISGTLVLLCITLM